MPHPNQPGGVTDPEVDPPRVAGRAPVVLVVDDDRNAIQALHAALKPLGVSCLFALNGAQALELAGAHRPDLVVLDVQMPGMDGFAVAQALQQVPALGGMPIVLTARHADVLTEARALDAGACDFIAKPYAEPVLRARVRNVLRGMQRADAAWRTEALRNEADSRSKTRMLSYLTHEVGNPLNGMLGFSQLLAMDTVDPLSTGQRKRVQQIIDCGQSLAALLRDVADLSRFEAGRFVVQAQPLLLADGLRRALDAVASQAERAGVALLQQVDPADAPGLAVQADPERLHQCLLNLLGHAVKRSRPGGRVGVAVRLEVRQNAQQGVREGGPRIGIEVLDDGPDLTPEQQLQLFEPFNRQGHSGPVGQGLGLAVSRMLTQGMGGELALHSQPGQGSRFTVWLQRADGPG